MYLYRVKLPVYNHHVWPRNYCAKCSIATLWNQNISSSCETSNVTNVVAVACFCDDVAIRHAHSNTLKTWVSLISHGKIFIATTRKGVSMRGYLSTVALRLLKETSPLSLPRKTPAGGVGEVEARALKLECGVTVESERVALQERHRQMTGEVCRHPAKLRLPGQDSFCFF